VYSACAKFDEEEYIECSQLDGFHCEEIYRQNLFFAVQHQMTPTDGSTTNGNEQDMMSAQRFLDRCL